MRWLDITQIPSLDPLRGIYSPPSPIIRTLNSDEKVMLHRELNGPAGSRWPLTLHRQAINAAMLHNYPGATGRILTFCLGLTNEAILALLHFSHSVGIYYCTNGEVGAYRSVAGGFISDILGSALTLNVAVYLGGPSLVAGPTINVSVSGGELLVIGATVIFTMPPPPHDIIGYQANVGIGVSQLPVSAAIDASYTWTRAHGTLSGGRFTPVPGSGPGGLGSIPSGGRGGLSPRGGGAPPRSHP